MLLVFGAAATALAARRSLGRKREATQE
jgi:hypothetical protein